MNIMSKYSLEIQTILQDIEKLKNRQIYEFDTAPGVPSCSTIGVRLESNILALLSKIDNSSDGDIETACTIINNA